MKLLDPNTVIVWGQVYLSKLNPKYLKDFVQASKSKPKCLKFPSNYSFHPDKYKLVD